MSLPYFLTDDRQLSLLQTSWQKELNPLLANPLSQGLLIRAIPLANGVTVVNHFLGRRMQGWLVSDVDGAATIYRSAPFNDLTLTLTSNAAVNVNLYVF